MINSQTSNRIPRLNPFVFPSDTDFRFVILIVAVLGASLFIYEALYRAILANAELINSIHHICSKAAQAAYPGSSFADQQAANTVLVQCVTPVDRTEAGWVILGVALLLSVAGAIYWAFPNWKIWRGGLKPLSAENVPPDILRCLSDLCREAELSRSPNFLLNPYRSASSGVTFGRLGQYYVVLSSGLVMQFQIDRPVFRAVVLHELGHIRNADVDKTYFTIAIGWAFGVVALVPWIVQQLFPPWHFDQTFNVGWRVLVLSLVIYLTRNAILRAREVYADVRASVWEGQGGTLDRVLKALPRLKGRYWQRLLHKHPDPQERSRALYDTSGLFYQGFWDAFATGIVAASAIANVFWLLDLLHIGYIGATEAGTIGTGAIFALLVVGVVGLGAWRASFASQVRGVALPSTVRMSLGLTLGLLLGDTLSLATYGSGSGYFIDVPSLRQFTVAALLDQVTLPFLWSTLLTIMLFFFLRWIVAGAATWLEVAMSSSSPRWIYWVGLAIASVVLGVWFGQFSVIRDLVRAALDPSNPVIRNIVQSEIDISSLDIRVSVALFAILALAADPLTFLAFISLWAYPLVAWFWHERRARTTGLNWVFLDSSSQPQQLTLPYQAPFRLGLAMVMGLAGGLALCGLLPLFVSGFNLVLSSDKKIVLAVLLQVGMAAIVAGSVRRLGGPHGLFAAFVAGCVMTGGIVGFSLLHKEQVDFNIVWGTFTQVVNEGALVALPVALIVSTLAGWVRRLGRPDTRESVA